MVWQYNPWALPLFFAAAISVGLALFMWPRRHLPGGVAFAALLLLISEMSLADGLEYMSADLSSILFWDKAAYVGLVSVPVAAVIFVFHRTGRDQWLRTRTFMLLCVIPAITLLLRWTDEYHHLIYSEIGLVTQNGLTILQWNWGYWFYIDAAYSYALAFLGVGLLAWRLSSSHGVARRQDLILILSIAVPLLAGVVEILNVAAYPIDWTSLGFAFTGVGFFWALFRFRLFELMPVAREAIVRDMPDGVIVLDPGGRVVYANPAGERVFGPSAGVVGKAAVDLFRDRGLKSECLTKDASDFDLAVNGDQRYFDLHFSFVHDENGSVTGRIGVVRDITERKKLESRLIEAQRLAAIGETTAMVGHDLRNPLQAMKGAVYLVKRLTASEKAEDKKGAIDLLNTLDDTVGYMDKIVSDLQDYSRPVGADLVGTSLPDLVRASVAGVKIPGNIRVTEDFQDGVSNLMLDPVLLRRVLTNLLMNAVQAMPDGGHLTISARDVQDMIVVTVQDTGLGIPAENLAEVFNPFFTTKAQGQGLGLAVCKRLIEAQGGTIEVASEVRKGTAFTLKIPTSRSGIIRES